MGIDAHAVHLLRYARKKYGAFGRTVTLGRQAVHLGPAAMKRWTGLNAVSGSAYCEPMLQTHFGAAQLQKNPEEYLAKDFAALAETMALAAGMKLTPENKNVGTGLE